MKKSKAMSLLFSIALLASMPALTAKAETIQQDGLAISLTTDKTQYAINDQVQAKVSVTNNNNQSVYQVQLDSLVPSGYALTSGSSNTKQLNELKAGETIELIAFYARSTGNTDSGQTPISKPEANPFSPTPVNLTNVVTTSNNSNSSETTTKNNTGNTNSSTTNSPSTGSAGVIPYVVAALSSAVLVIATKKGKGKKLFSILLCGSMLLATIPISTLRVDALGDKKADITVTVNVDGKPVSVAASVTYSMVNLDDNSLYEINVIPSYGGKVNAASGKYAGNSSITLEAIPDAGWILTEWITTEGGSFDDSKSSSTIFSTPNNATTVIAKFIPENQQDINQDDLDVYLAYHALEIGYSDGDFADSVTNQLELPTSYGEGEHSVDITWNSSNVGIVSKDGAVYRPLNQDEAICLTATLSKGTSSHEKEFEINVIKINRINRSTIHDNTEEDLEALNANEKYPLRVEYNEDDSQATFISGNFCETEVSSIDTAISSVYSVKSLIGLNDPESELLFNSVNHTDISLAYSFEQIYNGIPVYGRTVTITADCNTGKTRSLRSSVLSNDILSKTPKNPSLSKEDVVSKYSGKLDSCELIIYSLDEFENNPTLAYKCKTESATIIVDANTGELLNRFRNEHDWGDYSTFGSGKNEIGSSVTFPVQFHQWDWWFYYLEDVDRKIYVHGDKAGPIEHELNTEWGDTTANSAYSNVITVYDWYKNHLNRNSIDNRGMQINVNIHNYKKEVDMFGDSVTDNAHWDGDNNEMCFFENSKGGTPTTAAGLDIIAHEMTHGVLQYCINQTDDSQFPYANYTGSINEGYADVFGHFVDNDNWTIGENWKTIRSLSSPESYDAPDKMSSTKYIPNMSKAQLATAGENYVASTIGTNVNTLKSLYQRAKKANTYNSYNEFLYDIYQSSLVHTNSSIVYHAAYLMSSYGISRSTLEKIWYDSMSTAGYDATSTFYTVRSSLIQSGINCDLSENELNSIRRAFDEVEVYGYGKLKLTYTDENGNSFYLTTPEYAQNASVKLENYQTNALEKEYNNNLGTTAGYTYKKIYCGTYKLTVSVPGYETFTADVIIDELETAVVSVPLIKKSVGTLSGKICRASDRVTPIGGALISIYQNDNLVKTIPSLENGSYVTELPVGEYKVNISASGYITFDAYVNVTDENVTYLETFLLVDESDAASGNAYGQITNAITGKGLDDVTLYVRAGWNNITTVSVVATAKTDSEGRYELSLPLGNYTLYATKDGYVSNSFNIVVQENDTSNQNGTLTPIMSGDSFRIVLTWGENPSDLDSHVEGKLSDSYPFHVYYSDMKSNDGSVTVCELDVDDTTSYGPETITLTPTTTDAYYYYVFRYSGSGTVAASGAQIKVYQGENLVRTFNVPTDLGSSDYWNVFAIKEGELIVRNTITESAELNYAE